MISQKGAVESLIINHPGGYWGDHDSWGDWRIEVDNESTRLGFWEWLVNKQEQIESEPPLR